MQPRGHGRSRSVARCRWLGRGSEDRGARQRADGRHDRRPVRRAGIGRDTGPARARRGRRRRVKLVASGIAGTGRRRHASHRGTPRSRSAREVDAQQRALARHRSARRIGIVQRDGGLTQTAYALLADLVLARARSRSAETIAQNRPGATHGSRFSISRACSPGRTARCSSPTWARA